MQPKPATLVVLMLLALLLQAGCNTVSDHYKSSSLIPNRNQILTATPPPNTEWTPAEINLLKTLWLGSLPPTPFSPSNAVADNPQAAALGHKLFFDSRLSANNQVACSTCHRPDLAFTDGFPLSFGTRTTKRNAPTLIGAAYSPWLLWDGHKDSMWAQAMEPIEHPDEQGSTRLHAAHLIYQDESYRTLYETAFGPLPDALSDFNRFPDAGGPVAYEPYRANWEQMSAADRQTATQILVNLGKAIAAYERLLAPGASRFDTYVQAVLAGDVDTMHEALSPDEVAGLRLFIGKGDCIRCHSGPLFADFNFHNTGVPAGKALPPDDGRAAGIERVLADEFNCLGLYSDANVVAEACAALQSLKQGEASIYAFKTPTLRSVAETAPYMHAGQFETVSQVLEHYNQAPPAPLGQTEVQPLNLSNTELSRLEAFLGSLSAPPGVPPQLLKSP